MSEKKKTSLMIRIESCLKKYALLVDKFENSPNRDEVLERSINIYSALAVLSFSLWNHDRYDKLEQLILNHDERKIKKESVRIRDILAIAYSTEKSFSEERAEEHFRKELATRVYNKGEEFDFKKLYADFKETIENKLKEYLPENLKTHSEELTYTFVNGIQRAMNEGIISVKDGHLKKFSFLEKIWINILFPLLPVYVAFEFISSLLNIPTLLQVKLNEEKERQEYKNYNLMLYTISKPDPELGFVLSPNSNLFFNSTKGIEIDLQTDEYGFLKGEAEKKGSFIVVGDSFAFGFGVRREYAWPSVLEKLLNKEVTNFGVYGYALWQYNTLMRKFKQFENRIILYSVYTNDFFVDERRSNPQTYYEDNKWTLYKSSNPTIFQLVTAKTSREGSFLKRTFIYKSILEMCRQAEIDSFVNELCALYIPPPSIMNRKSGVELIYQGAEERIPTEEELQKAISDLHGKYKEAIETAQQKGSILVVVLFSSKNLAYRNMYVTAFGTEESLKMEEVMREETKDYFKRKGIPVIDVREPLEREQEGGREVFLKRDRHLNEYGNQIAAKEIACYLAGHRYVEPTNTISESCKEKPTLNSVVTSGIIHLEEIDF